ncbi:clathrin adaptor, mu subunit [Gloeophyllum trabeum ATCC 11539]|uniref:Clathrin adaptor, mu subunit n=1 Tax=Gloeophyllum trabeum (strain ATCC 11539 / FP-39264 / Madison 617) TaxID=670483 RepID=S7QJW5_GLOTA|nr:clathrin adaptor, mu subunit [Gloeophyllum trabeum ATCC 11539]EPQ59498.1 clathrin adaptor, mu subunit [Gloeophyllum trabeum ATCC 11539]
MAIDGLIILDNVGRPIVQTSFHSTSPAYPLIHIDTYNNALAKVSRPDDVDPVLYVSGINDDKPSACCHVGCGGLRILAPISGDVDPLFAFAYLRTFIDILREYLGHVSASTLRDNFDVVYQLLEETLDSGGHPLTTSPNALREIVIPPSLLNKLLSVAGANISSLSAASSNPFASPIPWRKANVRHNNNEIYFDVVEELRAVVNRSGVSLSNEVLGKIDTNSRLSGTPDLLLTFSNPKVLTDCSFHPCVRLPRWSRDKALSFVPPDGPFILMEYRFSPSSSNSSSLGVNQVPVPVMLKPSVVINENGGTIDLTAISRLSTRAIEDFTVELYLGQGAGAPNFMVSGGGSWAFDPRTLVLRWEMANLPPSSSHSLRGSWTSSIPNPRAARAFRVRFAIQQHTFSALKIDQLRLTGEAYKPYKGVRGRSLVDLEWRW